MPNSIYSTLQSVVLLVRAVLEMASEGLSTSSVSKGCFLFNPTTKASKKKKPSSILTGKSNIHQALAASKLSP